MNDIFSQGGWLIWPIFVSSLLAVGIIFERLWVLRKSALLPSDIYQSCEAIALSSQAEAEVIAKRGLLGELLAIALRQGADRATRQLALEQQSTRVAHHLERNLELLGVIAAVAPLLGLLGTVVGMIDVFSALMIHGAGNASVLAGGIGSALVTTATGLVVAIPALIGHRLLLRRVRWLLVEIESCCDRFLNASSDGAVRSVRAA